MFEKLNATLEQIKQTRPLVLNITNEVTMDFVANGLLSLGASPIMCKAGEEVEDLLKQSQALVINLGTLNKDFIQLCRESCRLANQLQKPIILDPVGAGASRYRTETCLSLIEKYQIAIIRGNASELMALSGSSSKTKGVDSCAEGHEALDSARFLSKRFGTTLAMSGKIDFIVDSERLESLDRGSAMMPNLTGTGCLLSAVVAAFHAVEKDRFEAAKMATLFYGLCGEKAEKMAEGPGSFRSQFLDALHLPLNRGDYEKN